MGKQMYKQMHNIAVERSSDGLIRISQEYNDMNMEDPVIRIDPEQATLVASWIVDAASDSEILAGTSGPTGNSASEGSVPVNYWRGGPMGEPMDMDIYPNASGMIVLKISDGSFLEVSPVMAKRMRENLSRAISQSLTNMFRSDTDA